MSVIGQEAGIEHGTGKGVSQHTYRKVPITETCGCRQIQRDRRNKSAAKTGRTSNKAGTGSARSQAQKEWYGGNFVQHDGLPTLGRSVSTPGNCPEPDCGSRAVDGQDLPRGWVRTQVSGSSEPARIHCSGSCAAVGVALAELRMCEA